MKKLKRLIGLFLYKVIGWKPFGERAPMEKYVLVAAPHTSNWDLPIMLAAALIFDVKLHWIGKLSLFRWPYGWFMRWLGGIPVDRSAPQGTVKATAQLFKDAEGPLVIVVPVEGTRSRREYWKSGFYWIAMEAQVPIVLGLLDYKEKHGGFGPAVMPTGDIKADMEKIRAFYKGRTGKFPEDFGPVRVKEEDAEG